MTAPNAALAYKVLDAIVAHPELHDQGDYGRRTSCGTTRCVAGWAVHLSGYQLDFGMWDIATHATSPDGEQVDIHNRARELLGLTEAAADNLFLSTTDGDVPRKIEKLFGPRPAVTS